METVVLHNVKPEIRNLVSSSIIATELARSMSAAFNINSYQQTDDARGKFESLYCMPNSVIASSLLADQREIFTVIATEYKKVQARIIKFCASQIHHSAPRLHPSIVIVVHGDPTGDHILRVWGRERGLHVIPLFRDVSKGLPDPNGFKNMISADLFSADPFDITGPVTSDEEFFGRKNEAFELVRQLEKGRIRSFFGIRKVGKTSIINRATQQAVTQHGLRVAFIDCSDDKFHTMKNEDALGIVAKTIELVLDGEKKYASTVEVTPNETTSLEHVLIDLPSKLKSEALAIVFDEIDYITPGSPTTPHWKEEFNPFWRKLRLHIQELQRKNVRISLLVSGVSSMWFREESINSVENSALHFVPEEYLSPFPRVASMSMIKRLGKKAGLIFNDECSNLLAAQCGDFPFWIRQAGSLIHRSLPIDKRPYTLTIAELDEIVENFIESEGAEIVGISLKHFSRSHPRGFKALVKLEKKEGVSKADLFTLEKYGLISKNGEEYDISCKLVKTAFNRIISENLEDTGEAVPNENNIESSTKIKYDMHEWAEELAGVNKRRNILEANLREFVRFAFKFNKDKKQSWSQKILEGIPEQRRKDLSSLDATKMMKELYFKDLIQIVPKHWAIFESHFGDKAAFEHHSNILNWRPDTHAKEFDALDLALQRNSLDWFEKILLK
ncbi:hypothetical protein ACFVHQ_12570 [Actinomycetes bacterium NPDC127524]